MAFPETAAAVAGLKVMVILPVPSLPLATTLFTRTLTLLFLNRFLTPSLLSYPQREPSV
jgi:hypothetical protein